MVDKIQIRQDTSANWSSNNPTMSQGELGLETDTRLIKIGDGSITWNNLTYINQPTLNNGTPGSGTTAAEYGDIYNHTTVLTMGGTLPSITGDVDQAVGLLIYTFPAGVIVVDSIHMDVGIIQSDGFINADTPDVGIGTLIGTGAIATLDLGTNLENYVTGQTAANATGTNTDKTELTAAAFRLIEAGGVHTVHLNAADGWDSAAGGDAAATLDGTVTIKWTYMGL